MASVEVERQGLNQVPLRRLEGLTMCSLTGFGRHVWSVSAWGLIA